MGEEVVLITQERQVTTPGILVITLATLASRVTLILVMVMPPQPLLITLLTHRTIPTVPSPPLQAPRLISRPPPPHLFLSTATRRRTPPLQAPQSHLTTRPQSQLVMGQFPRLV